jgi:hypothetical protein
LFQVWDADDGTITTERMTNLSADHEEADTRLLLHAKYVSETFLSYIIRSCDMLALVNVEELGLRHLFFSTGGNHSRLLHVNAFTKS